MRKTVACDKEGCYNFGIEITLSQWRGSQVRCGACKSIIEPQAEWYEPPAEEELGVLAAPQRVAELIVSMSETERQQLAELISPAPRPSDK